MFSEMLITAAGLLARLKTVDGAGSGLDSDTVDGLHAVDLASAAHTHSESDVVNLVDDLAGKQPLHDNLTGLSGAPAANEVVPYFDSSSGSMSTTLFPAFGRSVANLTNAGAGRTLFELGSAAVLSANNAANQTVLLDGSGKLATSVFPTLTISDVFVVASQASMLTLVAERGDVAIRTDNSRTYILATDSPGTLADWKLFTAAGDVTSVAGRIGTVVLTKSDVGLSNVDDTSDANKPVSMAMQTALDLKANLASPTFTTSTTLTTAGGTFTTLSRALSGGASANEVGLETTAATSNVAYYRNLSSTGYSAATFRDHLNVEHMAQGWHNSLGFAYTEVSNFGGDTAAAPPGYLFQQTGTMTFADSGTEYRQWNVQRIGGDDGIITWYAGTFRGEGLNVTLNRKTGAFVIGGTLSVSGIVNCNGAGSNTGGFYEYVRAGGWGLFGAVDDAQGDKLTIGSFRSNQWQQVRLYTNSTLGLTLDANQRVIIVGDTEVTTIGSGFILKSPDGARWRINVSNLGILTAAAA